MSRDSQQGSTKTGILSSDAQSNQTMPSLTSFRILQMTPSQVNTELIIGPIRRVCILLRNAVRKTVFVLFDDRWLVNKLRVRVQINYPAIATMPLGDLHTGTLVTNGTEEKPSQQVVVKVLRMTTGRNSPQYHNVKTDMTRKLTRECYMWSFLIHENVCPFKGLDEHEEFELPVLVSAFIPHRCMDYIRDHPESKLTVVRGVASGMKYLHDNGIVHGDMKPDNIMINNEGRAQLVNFRSGELESIIDLPIAQQGQRNTRFSAPELLRSALNESNDLKPTSKSDVFGFAMTMLQIMDGRTATLSMPYNHYRSEFQLWTALTQDDGGAATERPLLDRYENVPTAVQGLLQRCWEEAPKRRPSMAMVVSELIPIMF